ncbi:MAG: hypothetical protein HYT93_00145 [Parcubacteria group bacterium]|nr:hypothetical protein [Parcubacteria group bacterium]
MQKFKIKKYLFGLFIIIPIVGLSGYHAYQKSTPANVIFSEIGTYGATLTEQGFMPKEITIPIGSTIVFSTTLDKFFWPASNFHPSHAIYPEFDAKNPVPSGESWKFQFKEAGTWEYHDHLSPYFGGTIRVTDEINTTLKENLCENNKKQSACWRSLLFSQLKNNGIDTTFSILESLYKTELGFRETCHGITHDLGIESYQYFLKNKDLILTTKSSACAYGFYHGFMEALLTHTGDIQQAREFCLFIDKKITPDIPDATLQCFHGIGHGIIDMQVTFNGRQQDKEMLIKDALSFCESASRTDEELYRCASGIYNSVANIYILEKNWSLKQDEIISLCTHQPEKYKESCYGNMNSLMFRAADNNLGKSLIFINEIEEQYRESAVRYLSNLSVIYTILQDKDYDEEVGACRSLPDILYTACLEGLVHGLLEHGQPREEYKKVIDFCEAPILTMSETEKCFEYGLSNLGGWYLKEKSQEICNEIPETYKQYCKQV